MSAKSIKGITVQIAGDTTGLGSALKEIETQSAGLTKNLNAINRALKLDPTNTELLAEKQKVLVESIETTSKKLEMLKSVQDQVQKQYENGEIGQEAYIDFQKEIVYTQDKLERLQQQQESFGDTVESVANNL